MTESNNNSKGISVAQLEESCGGFATYSGTPFTGVAYEHRGNIVISELMYLDGLLHGTSRDFSSTGQLASETTFFRGVRHGLEREWSNQGKILSVKTFEFDIEVLSLTLSADGVLTQDWLLEPSHPNYQLLVGFRSHLGGEFPQLTWDVNDVPGHESDEPKNE